MRLGFMGTPDFAVRVLDDLVAAGHEIAVVYAQPPRRAGRGKAVRPSPVHARADALGIPVETPARFRDPEVLERFADYALDAAIVVAYGQILPDEALRAPRFGCLNIHASLLPRWRGAAPIQRAIMAGDAETGVMVMQMDAGLDTGPVLGTARIPIAPDETAAGLHDRLAVMGGPLLLRVLDDIASGRAAPRPQPSDGVTYASKIDKAEARIDWTADASTIDRQIRGLSPFPGAWCEIAGERIKVLLSAVADGTGTPGTVLDGHLTIACGTGAVRLLRLQRPGKGAVDADVFLNGYPVGAGQRLD